MSTQPTVFTVHRILAIVALVVALVLLLLWLVAANLLPFNKAVLFLLFDFVIWRTLDASLP